MKKQKYCSTANRVLCMPERIKLMRPGWEPATPFRKAGKGK